MPDVGKGILMRLNHRLDRQAIAQRTAAGALFCAAAFALLPNGFAWFGALLIACTALLPDGFSRAWCSHRLGLRPVLWLSLAVVVLAVTSMRLTGQNWSVVDNYARFLLLPWSALMVCALAPARQWLWLGALTGVAIAFALAVCELATGAVRVEAGHNSIVFANAVLMGINPFDQFGVELGKDIARQIEAGDTTFDPGTEALLARVGLGKN